VKHARFHPAGAFAISILFALAATRGGAAEHEAGFLDRLLAPYRVGVTTDAPCPPDSAEPRCRDQNNPPAGERPFSGNETGRAPAAGPYPRTVPETREALVREVQFELASRGYEVGDLDGLAGRETRAAVEAWQRDSGSVVDGRIDRPLLAQLERRAFIRMPFLSMALGRSPSMIASAQLELGRAGYYRGPVDGVLNPATRIAIRDYRTAPYEQIFIDGFPRDYPYLAPVTAAALPHVPLLDYPGRAELAEQPGYAALADGDYAAAITAASSAIREVATGADVRAAAFFVRGVARLLSGENTAASRDFTSVLRIRPDHAAAYLNRAIAYERDNLPEFARRDYRRALDLAPDLVATDRLASAR
jgi:tetratricopeptide (TPR) repeat protein